MDIAFGYEVPEKSVSTYALEVCKLIDECVDIIIFPLGDENALPQLEEEFMFICHGVFPGTVAAGDGIVFQMIKPDLEAVDGDLTSFSHVKDLDISGLRLQLTQRMEDLQKLRPQEQLSQEQLNESAAFRALHIHPGIS